MSWIPTHQTVANELGLTVATVSRIRTGARLPSFEVMQKIVKLTGWSLDDQATARNRNRGIYAAVLNERLQQWADRSEPATATNGD